jgi:hypothetical protein
MRIETGFGVGSVAHLTHTTLVGDALCGAEVINLGLPDLAVICEECDQLAVEAGGDRAEWLKLDVVVEQLLAA